MKYLALLTVALLPSCTSLAQPKHYIDATLSGPLILDVCDQHDESVNRDTVLVEAEKAQALRSTAIVREIVASAQGRE